MNQYFAPVNIPPVTLLFDKYDQILNRQSFPYYILEPSALSSLAAEFFKSLHVRPKFIVVFTHPKSTSPMNERIIHSDITLDKHRQWKPLHCALNWEVNPQTVAEWMWFDMSAVPEVWPETIPNEQTFQWLSGVHYGARQQKGFVPESIILEKAKLFGPHLVRVDVPHGVAYETPVRKQSHSFAKKTNSSRSDPWAQNRRASVSIRFEETNWNSWGKCLHAFRSILTNPITD